MACSFCRPAPDSRYQPTTVAAMAMGSSQHSRMIQAICRRREEVFFFMRDASKLQNTPPGTAGYPIYSTFRPSRPRKASICRAVSAALSPVSISQNTRSRGSVPEKRLTTQPPPLKYTLQPSA